MTSFVEKKRPSFAVFRAKQKLTRRLIPALRDGGSLFVFRYRRWSAGLFSKRLSEARSVLLIRYPPRVPCTSRVFLLQFWKEHFGGAYPLLDL